MSDVEENDVEEPSLPAPWREGCVDRSETHILIRYGGWLEREPEAVDIAFVGPDVDGGLIVEFLPMVGLDPDEAKDHREDAAALTDMVTNGWRNRWGKLLYQTNTASNAYRALRYLECMGRGRLVFVADPAHLEKGEVAKQPERVEGVGPSGRYVIYNKGTYVGVHLIRDDRTIKGWLAAIHEDCLALVLTQPVQGGCVLRRIYEPHKNGMLVDDRGVLTLYGQQVVAELVGEMHDAAVAMEGHITEVRKALWMTHERLNWEPLEMLDEESWLRMTRRAVAGPAGKMEAAFFYSVVGDWAKRKIHGFENPVSGEWAPEDWEWVMEREGPGD